MADSDTTAEQARKAAIDQAISTIVYLSIMIAAGWAATAGRDTIARYWMAAKAWRRPRDPYAADVAAFRRDIADISRGTEGPDTTRVKGLYER